MGVLKQRFILKNSIAMFGLYYALKQCDLINFSLQNKLAKVDALTPTPHSNLSNEDYNV